MNQLEKLDERVKPGVGWGELRRRAGKVRGGRQRPRGLRQAQQSPLLSPLGMNSLCRERVDGAGDEHEPGQEQLVLGPGHGGGGGERDTAGTPATSTVTRNYSP